MCSSGSLFGWFYSSFVQVLPLINLCVRGLWQSLLAVLLEHILNLLCCVVWQYGTCPCHGTKMARVFLFSVWVLDLWLLQWLSCNRLFVCLFVEQFTVIQALLYRGALGFWLIWSYWSVQGQIRMLNMEPDAREHCYDLIPAGSHRHWTDLIIGMSPRRMILCDNLDFR